MGSVIVHNGVIIGEGWHQRYGEAHAEVNAIKSVKNPALLKDSTLYVNLEPCAHFGKTPPCADLIIRHNIPRVVIGCRDSYSEVDGKGIGKLKAAGIDVTLGVLADECRELNKRFFTFHEKKRPYIILKWAQTADGFVDRVRNKKEKALKISSELSTHQVHLWRSQEQAILIGKNTLIKDNPALDARFGNSPSPTIVVLGYEKGDWQILKSDAAKMIFNKDKSEFEDIPSTTFYQAKNLNEVLSKLYASNICSVMVEGGTKVLESFIAENLWDEIRLIKSNTTIGKGVKAPELNTDILKKKVLLADDFINPELSVFVN